jgi:RimJ/RimL family protein N-acetyltransferase
MEGRKEPGIIVRAIEPGDFKDVVSNYYSVYDELDRNPYVGILLFEKKPSLKDERKWFEGVLQKAKKGTGFVLVAEVDGRVVGQCTVEDKTPQMEQRHVGVVGILIRDGYRSRGIGSALFAEMIKRAKKEKRYKILDLAVFGCNKHAQRLYRRFGFKVYGAIPDGILRKNRLIDDVYMYRRL